MTFNNLSNVQFDTEKLKTIHSAGIEFFFVRFRDEYRTGVRVHTIVSRDSLREVPQQAVHMAAPWLSSLTPKRSRLVTDALPNRMCIYPTTVPSLKKTYSHT